jgi:hypothetical protein
MVQHDSVPQGRLKIALDCIAVYFSAFPAELSLEMEFSHTLVPQGTPIVMNALEAECVSCPALHRGPFSARFFRSLPGRKQ